MKVYNVNKRDTETFKFIDNIELVDTIEDADIVFFGGNDIVGTENKFGEYDCSTLNTNDKLEASIFNKCKGKHIIAYNRGSVLLQRVLYFRKPVCNYRYNASYTTSVVDVSSDREVYSTFFTCPQYTKPLDSPEKIYFVTTNESSRIVYSDKFHDNNILFINAGVELFPKNHYFVKRLNEIIIDWYHENN
jgi:hypothetical protein